jgi:ribosome-binding protein aMBF1 (putative translation factor)
VSLGVLGGEKKFDSFATVSHVQALVLGGGATITMAKTKDALKILERITGNGESVKTGIAEARVNLEVAQMIYDARTRAGLSQSQLAALVGSKQSVIARIEDADYVGHSLTMLQRIATALEQRVELRFVPQRTRRRSYNRKSQGPLRSPRKLKSA